MANQLIIPYQNPVKFLEINPTEFPQYLSKHFEKYFFQETIKDWEQKTQYLQPFQNSDSIKVQVEANYGPILCELIDIDERVWFSDNFDQVLISEGNDGFAIYEITIPLTTYPENVYFLRVSNILVSEPIKISPIHKYTVLLEYKHHAYTGDVVWQTGFSPSLRIRATVSPESPSSKDSFFEDQQLNLTLEDSKPFEVFRFLIGGPTGIPFWMAKKLNRILGCSTLKIDGIQYTKNSDKLEPNSQANYPMKGYSIELRETINRGSQVVENDNVVIGKTSMIATVLGDGFGMNEGSGSEQQITVFQ